MFIDKAKIFVKAGKGGDGCLSFRREKFIPKGGPDGGKGGDGGSVYLQANSKLKTLQDFTFHPHFHAGEGENGRSSNKYGKSAEDLIISVPCGTLVYGNGELLEDLLIPEEKILVARGGRGGRGNAAFKTARNTAPRIAEKGEPGEVVTLELELKLLADVGIIGYPNAGKSTLLSRVSAARPKIADYPFTTLVPNLGMVRYQDKSFILADIPGLIEGAHRGKGLGDEFLRHIERTRLLIHIVDVLGFSGKDPYANFLAVNQELKSFSEGLSEKKQIVALNKIDSADETQINSFIKKAKKYKIFPISAVTGQGVEELLGEIVKQLEKIPPETKIETEVRYIARPAFSIERQGEIFLVSGRKVESLAAMTDFDQPEAVKRLQNILKKIGLDAALAKAGAKTGDIVKIGEYEFGYEE